MRKKLFSPTAIGGYGAIILTLVTFFAQGGFGKMTPMTYLYIIGLVIGVGLVVYSIIKPVHQDKRTEQRRQLREQYTNTIEIPKLLWRLYERAKELVISDPQKDSFIAKIPNMDKIMAESGYFSPSNRSLTEIRKFAKSMGNPLIGKTPKLKSKVVTNITKELIKGLLSVQGAIDAQGVGALKLVYDDQEVCKELLLKLNELKIELPDKIRTEVDMHIQISTAVANSLYFTSGLASEIPSQFITILPILQPALDSMVGEINTKITKLIEAFLSGEDINK